MYNTNGNASGNTIDGLHSVTGTGGHQAESVASAPTIPLPNGNNIMEECRRSYRVIKGSLLLYLIYLIAEICYWIGETNYISEQRLQLDATADSTDTEYEEVEDAESYTLPFLASNVIFGVVLGIQLLYWQLLITPSVLAEPSSASSKSRCGILDKSSVSKFQIIGVICILVTIGGSILDLIGMITYEEYYFDEDNYYVASSDDAEEEERLLRMLLWGSFWSASLWSLYFISFFWLYNKQLYRLIFSSILYIIHCILFAPFFEDQSNDFKDIADTFEDNGDSDYYTYYSEYYTRGSTQLGLAAGSLFGMIGICGVIIIVSIYLKYCINNNNYNNGSGSSEGNGNGDSLLVKPGILYKNLYILCGICLIIGIIIYLIAISCFFENSIASATLIFVLPVVYGPIVIAYDIFSFVKCQP